jgi:hypothetical protein
VVPPRWRRREPRNTRLRQAYGGQAPKARNRPGCPRNLRKPGNTETRARNSDRGTAAARRGELRSRRGRTAPFSQSAEVPRTRLGSGPAFLISRRAPPLCPWCLSGENAPAALFHAASKGAAAGTHTLIIRLTRQAREAPSTASARRARRAANSIAPAKRLVKTRSPTRVLRKKSRVGGNSGRPTVRACHQPAAVRA